jgi:GNAT superfamily N-acetyltransferase
MAETLVAPGACAGVRFFEAAGDQARTWGKAGPLIGTLRRNFSQCRSNFAQATVVMQLICCWTRVHPNRSEIFGSPVGREARTPERLKSGDLMYETLIIGGTVRRLWLGETELYRQHLLRLDPESRRNRFGGAVSDEFVRRYSEPSALRGVIIYGFFVDGVLRGAAELRLLARAGDAEAALSVEPSWQSRGVRTALLDRVLLAARNRQVNRLHMLCLAENRRLQQLARKFDAELSFQSGSVMGEMKTPEPTPISMMRELVADGTDLAMAMLDVPSQRRERRYERLVPVDNWG